MSNEPPYTHHSSSAVVSIWLAQMLFKNEFLLHRTVCVALRNILFVSLGSNLIGCQEVLVPLQKHHFLKVIFDYSSSS